MVKEEKLKELIIDRQKLGETHSNNIARFAKILLGAKCNCANSINGQNLIKEVNKLSDKEKKVLMIHYGLDGQQPKNINNFGEALKAGIHYSPSEILAIEAIAFYKLRQGVIVSRYFTPNVS